MLQRIAIGAIVAFIAVSAIVFVLYQQQESQPLVQDHDPVLLDFPVDEQPIAPEQGSILLQCGTQETQYKRDLCWMFEASDGLDASKCLKIVERPVRIDCIRVVAKLFESPETSQQIAACEESFSEEIPSLFKCLEVLEPQIRAEKLSVCDSFLSDDVPQLYMCRSEVAKELFDKSICDAMPEQPTDYKAHCHWILDSEF